MCVCQSMPCIEKWMCGCRRVKGLVCVRSMPRQAHLWGHTRVGENVEDEWLVVYLLHAATKHPDLQGFGGYQPAEHT